MPGKTAAAAGRLQSGQPAQGKHAHRHGGAGIARAHHGVGPAGGVQIKGHLYAGPRQIAHHIRRAVVHARHIRRIGHLEPAGGRGVLFEMRFDLRGLAHQDQFQILRAVLQRLKSALHNRPGSQIPAHGIEGDAHNKTGASLPGPLPAGYCTAPQEGQTRCGILGSPQFGQLEGLARVMASWGTALSAAGF